MATWRPRSGAFEPAPSLYVLDYGLDLPLTGSEPQLTENDETLGCGTASLCWYQDRHGGGQPRSESSLLALAGVMVAVGSVFLLDRLAILAKSPNLSVSQAESHFAPLVLVQLGLTLPIAPARPSKWSRLMTSDSGEKIHAVMVDDEDLTRQILRKLLSSHPEIEIVAEFCRRI